MLSRHTTHNKKAIHPVFKYSLIASTVLGLAAQNTHAQEAEDQAKDDTVVEVIDVRGVRGDLMNAQNMKREGDTLLDAISAEDIGILPDRSVLEAISRVPGVSIGRFAAPNDPDHFGTEGSGVVIRGLTQVRSEFNGRDTFTANSGRSLSFEDVPPELMGSVEVFKNQTADMVEGAIAGTVNLNTKKPFDSNGRVLAFSADATYADFIEETTPTFSGLYSDVWELDQGGRLGLLLNVSSSELKAQSDGTQVGRYDLQNAQYNGADAFVPRSTRLTRKQDDRTRKGFAAVVQWENADNTLDVTAEFIRSDSNLAWTENAIEFADDDRIGDSVPADGTTYEFDDQGYFQRGIISSTAGWRGNDAQQPGGIYGQQHAMVSRYREDDSLVEDLSLNVVYTPTDQLAINFDVQKVKADTQILDFSVMGATRMAVDLDLSGSGIPKVGLLNPGYTAADPTNGLADHFTNPNQSFMRSAMDHISDNEGDQFSTRLDVKYTFAEGAFTSVSAGARYADRDQTTRESTYNWGNVSEAWAAGGSAWFDDPRAEGVPTDIVNFDNFARGGVLSIQGGNNVLFPAMSIAENYRDAVETLSGYNPAWTPLNQRDGAVGDHLPNEINRTQESSTAFYVKANFEGYWGDMDYQGNFGLRYVKLENDTDGFVVFPDLFPDTPEDPNNFLPANQSAFGNADSRQEFSSSEYTNVLPSFNMKLNLSDELLMRVGFSEGISLPQLGLLRNFVNITAEDLRTTLDPNTPPGQEPTTVAAEYGRFTANSGNPFLKPMESYNYDLTLEWYFDDGEGVGSLTGSLFYKDLKNYFINDVSLRQYTNNGVTETVQVQGASNGDSGRIQGFEIAFSNFFDSLPEGWNGLGLQFNYTFVDEEGSPNANLSPDNPAGDEQAFQAFENLPLEGLSKHNANIVGLYEKYGFTGRLAYNWRSSYLLTTRDVITTLPIYNEDSGFLDGSVFYDINENFKVGLQVTNILDEVTETTMQINEEGDRRSRSFFVNDRRVSFILRGSF